MKKFFFLIYLLIILNYVQNAEIIKDDPPTQNQDATAAQLSYKLYDGAYYLNNDAGCVIDKGINEEYAVWKQYRTKECYVVIRGTNNWGDILADANIVEEYDQEIGVYVHKGVKERTESILSQIGEKLIVCKRDIIITGHSLGGAVAHYLFLIYVKRHYYDWNQKEKASKFKVAMFGAPQLISGPPNDELLVDAMSNINWYKYEKDVIPEIVRTLKNCIYKAVIVFRIMTLDVLSNIGLTALKKVHYGNYIPGYRYHLTEDGKKTWYVYKFGQNLFGILDHMNMKAMFDAIYKNGGWGSEKTYNDPDDVTKCIRFNFDTFLDEEKEQISIDSNNQEISLDKSNNEEIDINTTSCQNVDGYNSEAQFQDLILYLKNDNVSYILKRILDNKKEYEYVLCNKDGLVIKQCDRNCKCHIVEKNDRPQNITMCSSYQPETVMNCLVDGEEQLIETRIYFSLMSQRKIKDYFLMDYFCNNQIYQRGNYQNNSERISIYSALLLFLLLFLL